jgi:uncharacterized membrane protein (DUF4010 family)
MLILSSCVASGCISSAAKVIETPDWRMRFTPFVKERQLLAPTSPFRKGRKPGGKNGCVVPGSLCDIGHEGKEAEMDRMILQSLAVALGLGLLVGFQREWSARHVAGIRTFTLITVFGAINAAINAQTGGWLLAFGLAAVAAILVTRYRLRCAENGAEPGLTTLMAGMVMYSVGAAAGLGHTLVAVVGGGGTAALLQWKRPLHNFVQRLGEAEFRGIIQLALIALVILPLLPNESYDPYGVINPFEIWLMVALIVGISLGGYIGFKFWGASAGAIICGVLGGLISSTATTVSYARRSRRSADIAGMAAVVLLIASTIVFGRVLVEIAVVAPGILATVSPPLLAMMAVMILISALAHHVEAGEFKPPPVDEDPAEIKAAVIFGLLYAGVLFAVAAVKEHFGDVGLYVVAALSGLTDMDAITLSTAQMIKKGNLDVDMGWRMILIGALSNLVFKFGVVAMLGSPKLRARLAIAFGAAFLGGVAILLFWP